MRILGLYVLIICYNCTIHHCFKMNVPLEIKPGIGLSELLFGASVKDSEAMFGIPEEVDLLDDIEDCHSTVLHYWKNGFSLFFDEANHRLFCCVDLKSKFHPNNRS